MTPRIFFLAASLSLLAGGSAVAQTSTITGHYNRGADSGTYVRTINVAGATRTSTTVYTRSRDSATSTDSSVVTHLSKGVRSVSSNRLDFNETAAFISQKTVTKQKSGQFVGVGTYTTADGDSGALSTLESNVGQSHVVSATRNSPTTGLTQDLRVEEDALNLVTVKRLTLKPDGTTHTTVFTRVITGYDTADDE